jgi:hypothetical protein
VRVDTVKIALCCYMAKDENYDVMRIVWDFVECPVDKNYTT